MRTKSCITEKPYKVRLLGLLVYCTCENKIKTIQIRHELFVKAHDSTHIFFLLAQLTRLFFRNIFSNSFKTASATKNID